MKRRKFIFVALLMAFMSIFVSPETYAVQRTVGKTNIQKAEADQMISKAMTFEQMIEQIAEDYEISTDEAQQRIGYSDLMAQRAIQSKATYRTLSQMFTVNASYKPTMRFYCETSESGNFRAIKK
jgi:hypothetical protein